MSKTGTLTYFCYNNTYSNTNTSLTQTINKSGRGEPMEEQTINTAHVSESIADASPEKQYLAILMFNNLVWKSTDEYLRLQKSSVYFFKVFILASYIYLFFCNYVVAWRYNILTLML